MPRTLKKPKTNPKPRTTTLETVVSLCGKRVKELIAEQDFAMAAVVRSIKRAIEPKEVEVKNPHEKQVVVEFLAMVTSWRS